MEPCSNKKLLKQSIGKQFLVGEKVTLYNDDQMDGDFVSMPPFSNMLRSIGTTGTVVRGNAKEGLVRILWPDGGTFSYLVARFIEPSEPELQLSRIETLIMD